MNGDELNIKGFTDFLIKYAVFNFEHKRNVKNSLTPVLIFESMITRLKRTAERKGTARSNSYRKTEEDRSTSTGEKLYNIQQNKLGVSINETPRLLSGKVAGVDKL